jgi:hypothetical protein
MDFSGGGFNYYQTMTLSVLTIGAALSEKTIRPCIAQDFHWKIRKSSCRTDDAIQHS